MADFANAKATLPRPPSAGSTALGYQWLFVHKDEVLHYYKWKLGNSDNVTAIPVQIGGQEKVNVGIAGIHIGITDSKDLRIYLISKDHQLVEINLSPELSEGPKWEYGDLYTKAHFRAAEGSTLSVIDSPLQIVYVDEKQTSYFTAAYWDRVNRKWLKKSLDNLDP